MSSQFHAGETFWTGGYFRDQHKNVDDFINRRRWLNSKSLFNVKLVNVREDTFDLMLIPICRRVEYFKRYANEWKKVEKKQRRSAASYRSSYVDRVTINGSVRLEQLWGH